MTSSIFQTDALRNPAARIARIAGILALVAGVVPAHGRLRVQALDIGPVDPQASSSGCRVVGVTPA